MKARNARLSSPVFVESLESRRLFTQTVVYTYTGPGQTTAPGVTANWYSTPENSVGGNTLKGLNGNTSRPLVLNGLPSHSTISIAFDLVTTGTFSGGNFSVVQRAVGPGPSYTVTNTTRFSKSVSHTGSGVTYTRHRIEFPQSDNRLDLQFNMSGVPSQFGTWGIDNVSVVNDRETPAVSISATDDSIDEGESAGATFTITRTTADESLDVPIRLTGDATPIDDYTVDGYASLGGNNDEFIVHFDKDQFEQVVTLSAEMDEDSEDGETIQLDVYSSDESLFTVGSPASASALLVDFPILISLTVSDDAAPVRTASADSAAEVVFHVGAGLDGSASIRLDALTDSRASSADILWRIEQASDVIASGSFANGNVPVDLDSEVEDRIYYAVAAFDSNADGIFNEEPTRTIAISVVGHDVGAESLGEDWYYKTDSETWSVFGTTTIEAEISGGLEGEVSGSLTTTAGFKAFGNGAEAEVSVSSTATVGVSASFTQSWTYDLLRRSAVGELRELSLYTLDTPLTEADALTLLEDRGYRLDSWQSHLPFAIEPIFDDESAYEVTTYQLHGLTMTRIEFYTFSDALDTKALEVDEYVFARGGGSYETKLHEGVYTSQIGAYGGIVTQILEDAGDFVGVPLELN